jgi:hypothetical protein
MKKREDQGGIDLEEFTVIDSYLHSCTIHFKILTQDNSTILPWCIQIILDKTLTSWVVLYQDATKAELTRPTPVVAPKD